jgi:hypothetical protein
MIAASMVGCSGGFDLSTPSIITNSSAVKSAVPSTIVSNANPSSMASTVVGAAASISKVQPSVTRVVTFENLIHGLYVAMYGHPADAEGYKYWLTQVNLTADQAKTLPASDFVINSLARMFAANSAFDPLYGMMSVEDSVLTIYLHAGGGSPDVNGQKYWVDRVMSLESSGFSQKISEATVIGEFAKDLINWNASNQGGLSDSVYEDAKSRQNVFYNRIDNSINMIAPQLASMPPKKTLPLASVVNCPASAADAGQTSGSYSCTCAPVGSGNVWGTSTYTHDSILCVAAVHVGAISSSGGTINYSVGVGTSSYMASVRNGISSRSFSAWPTSVTFPGYSTGTMAPPNTQVPKTTTTTTSPTASSVNSPSVTRGVTVQYVIHGLYLAFYNRYADTDGYAYWVNYVGLDFQSARETIASSAQIDALAMGFAANAAWDQIYGNADLNSYIGSMYSNVGNAGSDSDGYYYWQNRILELERLGFSHKVSMATMTGEFVAAMISWNAFNQGGLSNDVYQLGIQRQNSFYRNIGLSISYSKIP